VKVVQCWDDGVAGDIRLTELFRKYGARATFNLNPGLHGVHRSPGGSSRAKLGRAEMRTVYDGFEIGNHTMTHPHLEALDPKTARAEILDARKWLQDFFGQPVTGFAYPFGTWNPLVVDLLAGAGHHYGRTVDNALSVFPPENPLTFHPTCHFADPRFMELYHASKTSGVFYFWGHSYELDTPPVWNTFEKRIIAIGDDPDAQWSTVSSLFSDAPFGLDTP